MKTKYPSFLGLEIKRTGVVQPKKSDTLLFRYCLLGYGHLRLSEKNILEGVDEEAVAYAQFYISA